MSKLESSCTTLPTVYSRSLGQSSGWTKFMSVGNNGGCVVLKQLVLYVPGVDKLCTYLLAYVHTCSMQLRNLWLFYAYTSKTGPESTSQASVGRGNMPPFPPRYIVLKLPQMYAPGGISVASLTSIMASGSAGDFFFWMFTLDNGWCFYQNTYTSPGNFVCRFLGGLCIYALGERNFHCLQLLWLIWLVHPTWESQEPPNTMHTLPGMFCKFQHFAQRLQAIKVGWQLLSNKREYQKAPGWILITTQDVAKGYTFQQVRPQE